MPAIWLGDLNVAPEPIDVYHPDHRVNDPDFYIDAREAYRHAVSWGFTDVFRKLYPDRVQYTYWDYFRNAFAHNWGWRIDHILATAPFAAACRYQRCGSGNSSCSWSVRSRRHLGGIRLRQSLGWRIRSTLRLL
jgi:exodeoxyribonuclease III